MKRPVLRAISFARAGVNPFTYDHNRLKFTSYQIGKIALNTVILAPFRLIVLLSCVLFAWLLSLLILVGVKSSVQISSGWRRVLVRLVVLCGRGALLSLGFWWIKVTGRRAPRETAPVLIVPRHSSYIDFLVSTNVVGDGIPIGLNRDENAHVPLFGTMMKATQQIFVSRTDPDSKRTAIKQMRECVADNRLSPLIVFPEGLCTNRKALITFKQGAFVLGCPVQPVVYHYYNQMDTTTWTWTGLSGGLSFYLTLCQFANYLEIEYYPVYKPSAVEIADPILYANNVRSMMAKALSLPALDLSYKDISLMMAITEDSGSLQPGIAEFVKLKDSLKVRFDLLERLLGRASDLGENRDGYVNIEEFLAFVNLPVSSQLRDIFNLYCRNHNGQISLKEYLISVALICDPTHTEDILFLAFQTFGVGDKAFVTRHELTHILFAAFDGIEDEHVDEVFSEADVDHQGTVSYDQFAQFCSKRSEYAVLFHWYRKQKGTDIFRHSKTD